MPRCVSSGGFDFGIIFFLPADELRKEEFFFANLFRTFYDIFKTNIERFCKWLSVEYVCFHAVVMHCREDAILSRLEVIPVTIQFDAKFCQSLRSSSSPPQLTTPSASVPQDSIAQ